MNWNRLLSGLLGGIYLVGSYAHGGIESAWKVGLGLLLPLACIWFADAMGDYTGGTTGGGLTSPTPGWLVCIGGWLMLLLPLIIGIVYALFHIGV